ncbi:MAG: branched-chain amino acid ABC transporter permease [Candidatus Tectomicrobia bacterium]|nr:branched-chain amino acid ABC transporter permease [Candidatus Tectomicrobia bacterium]
MRLDSPRTWSRGLLGLLLAGLLLLPLVTPRFYPYLAMQVLILSLMALGFNLLFGYTGLLSFGHAAFYAAGAYGTGLLLKHTGVSLLPAVLGGAVAATLLAVVIGCFCVRHLAIYFAMLTLAFGMMIHSVVWKWRDVTGGDDGLIGIPRAALALPGLGSVPMVDQTAYYYFVLAVSLAAIVALRRVVRSPFGMVLQAIRENEERAAFAGFTVWRYRLGAFVLSGAYAGLAGAMLAPLENTVAPGVAHWTKSAEPVLATLLGGPYVFSGPIVGSVLFLLLKEAVVRVTQYWLLVFGVVLLALVLGFRGGFVGALVAWGRRLGRGLGPG